MKTHTNAHTNNTYANTQSTQTPTDDSQADKQPEPTRWLRNWMKSRFTSPRFTIRERKDLLTGIAQAHKSGAIGFDARNMIHGVLKVDEQQVRDAMIPRSQIHYIRKTTHFRDIVTQVLQYKHSRYPVYGDDRDDIEGILLAKELLQFIGREDEFNIEDVMRPAIIVPETKPLNELLTEFKDRRNHMAVVIDEYSGISGLITIEDVLEEIVGEIVDEHDIVDEHENHIHLQTSSRYTVSASTPIPEFNRKFKTHLSRKDFDTIGGIIINKLGKIPRKGDELSLEGLLIRVKKSNQRRVDTLEVVTDKQARKMMDSAAALS